MIRANKAFVFTERSPTSGVGLLSTRTIRDGQRVRDAPLLTAGVESTTDILHTRPWVMTNAACTGDAATLGAVQDMVARLQGMPFTTLEWEPKDSRALDAIVGACDLTRNDVFRIYSIICSANVRDEAGTAYLLDQGAYMNHACVPNMRVQRDTAYVLVAVRDISPGEEITISYVPDVPLEEKALRAALLKSLYGMVCVCPCCVLDLL